MSERDYEIFEIENFSLERGITLPRAELAYKTYGKLAQDKSNVILYPTSYGAQHHDTEWLIGPARVLEMPKEPRVDTDRPFRDVPRNTVS